MTTRAEAHPAATVVVVRDGAQGLEALLLRRNSRLDFHGGAWVFPGGRLDPDDLAQADGVVEAAARLAAAREAREEADLRLDPTALIALSRWVTPVIRPKRFDTYFYAAALDVSAVVEVDGGEICDHRWLAPGEALEARARGEIELPPPTFVTLLGLLPFARSDAALVAIDGRATEEFRPRIHRVEDGLCSLYGGDAGYEVGDLERPGPRHRLWMLSAGWRYQRELD